MPQGQVIKSSRQTPKNKSKLLKELGKKTQSNI